jgi:hypothetical protein
VATPICWKNRNISPVHEEVKAILKNIDDIFLNYRGYIFAK